MNGASTVLASHRDSDTRRGSTGRDRRSIGAEPRSTIRAVEADVFFLFLFLLPRRSPSIDARLPQPASRLLRARVAARGGRHGGAIAIDVA